MAFPENQNINDLEKAKFKQCGPQNKIAVRTCIEDGDINVNGVTNETITNKILATAGIEYTHTLTNDLRHLMFKARDRATLRFAFSSGDTATKYITIEPCGFFDKEGLQFSGKTLRLRTDTPNTIVEILELS